MSATTGETAPRTRGRAALSRNGPRLTARAAGLLVAMALLAVMAIVPTREYLAQRGRIVELERRTAELEQTNADLRAQIQRLHDPAELERLARECLGMVAAGEVALVTPGQAPGKAC